MSADLNKTNLRPKPEDPAARFRPGALDDPRELVQQRLLEDTESSHGSVEPRSEPTSPGSATRPVDPSGQPGKEPEAGARSPWARPASLPAPNPVAQTQEATLRLRAGTLSVAPNQRRPSQPAAAERDSGATRVDWRETLKFAPNESIASILLKMEQVPGPEIAIVAPPELKVFRNPVSMRLLQRKAEDLGLDVTVISDDELTRSLCAEIGFGCYGNVKSFRQENSRSRGQGEPAFARRSIVSAVGGLCLAALAGFIAFFVMPAASVTVTPVATNLPIDVSIAADSSIPGVDVANARIPAKFVTSGDVDGTSVVSATGQRDLPNQPAKGFVTFTNKTEQPVQVPKSTVLLAGKVAFFTVGDTTVSPSITVGSTAIPGSGSAPIQASDPGPDGNVPVGAITAIQGDLASKLTVINHGATTGGSNKKGSYLSAEDQAKAKAALLAQLRQQALDKIQSQVPKNESFIPSPGSDGEDAIQELTYEESPEQVTGQTKLHMRINLRGLAFQGDDVNQVVTQAMNNALKQRGDSARLAGDPISIDPPVVAGNDGSTVKLQVHAVARIITPMDPAQVAAKIRGLSAEDARVALLGMNGVGDANVQLWPVWSRKVPSFSWRIHTSFASPSS
ncbi:MAG TPA: baseplate J/gp47 family protein [Chloroflexota bacterium]|nr:baseplate J/gp47 family protein [Chloroflexota bacterium]